MKGSLVSELPASDGLRQAICAERTGAQRDQFAARLQSDVLGGGLSVLDHAADPKFQFCGVPVLSVGQGSLSDRLKSRHIGRDVVWRTVCKDICDDMNTVLPIVAGESGSGKTVAAILAGAGTDRKGVVVYVAANALPPDETSRNEGDDMIKRNTTVIDALESVGQRAMRSGE